MRFLKIFFAVFLSFFLLLSNKTTALADDAFAVDASVTYKVEDTGKTIVTHDISLENLFSTLYATTYTLTLENITVQNPIATDSNANPIKVDVKEDGTKTDLLLTFSDAVVGRGKVRNFSITYENSGFATKTGEVWEISIPKISAESSFRNYSVGFIVPNSLGQEAYISPQPKSIEAQNGYKKYVFSKDQIVTTGVTAGFGEFQVFSFDLSYHLENPLNVNSQTEIAIPPDTAFQKVYFSKVEPKPVDVKIDPDGNWLAVYKLSPRERVDVSVVGSVQIFASYRHFPRPSQEVLNTNLKETEYWQVNSDKIKLLASSLKTPQEIYNFVTQNLRYDTSRVVPNVQRMGAEGALTNPTQAICMEFTDLFIALSRAIGVPAREVNGYAYTENKELQPLSLVNDVLHAWPEYYDSKKGAWIPIDPTWGSTSGVDYFNKLDLRHFAFTFHGAYDTQPYPPGSYKLGANPQKDVFVSFGQLPEERVTTPEIKIEVVRNLPFLESIYKVRIVNPGPSSLENFYPKVYFDDKEEINQFVQLLPPFATFEFEVKIPFSLLGKDTPDIIKVFVNSSQATFETNKTQVVVNSLLAVFAFMIFIVILVLIKLKKINFLKLFAIIVASYEKVFKKSPKDKNNS